MIVSFLQALLAFVIVLAPLVFFHELGHFLTAKMFRIGVPVFSLGFGPRLWGFRRRETDYRLSLIPLGGYVRLAGDESDETRSGSPDEFLSRPKWQRFVVFVAGASFNIVLAFFALWLFFGLYGAREAEGHPVVWKVEEGSRAAAAGVAQGDEVVEIAGQEITGVNFLSIYNLEITLAPNTTKKVVVERGDERVELMLETGADPKYGWGAPGWTLVSAGSGEQVVIHEVIRGEPADEAGLLQGDRVVAAGGQEPITEIELRLLIRNAPGEPLELDVDRAGRRMTISVIPRENEAGKGYVGIGFRPRRPLSIGQAAMKSLTINLTMSKTLFVVLKRLVSRELPLRSMSGPIGIAQVAKQALIAGPETFLYLLGFFSLQLGILNLLPIPVLDGGHVLILLVEGVMRRELSEKVKERVMQAGFVFLLTFMGVIIVLDVVKSWG